MRSKIEEIMQRNGKDTVMELIKVGRDKIK